MRELMVALVRSLIKNGVKAPADVISFVEDSGRFTGDVSTIILDFSEHDKMVAEEKDKRIVELEKIIDEKSGGWGKYGLTFYEIIELEDRHKSDCIRINQLLTTIDVLTERYQKLREVQGL